MGRASRPSQGPMPRKFFRKYLPDHHSVRHNRWLSWCGPLLEQPNLWALNRHSVSGGVAVGMFAGLVPGPLQMMTAAIIAIPLRVNLPVALACTLYTNPITIGPLYLVALELGLLLVGGKAEATASFPALDLVHLADWSRAFADWVLSLGKPLLVGLVALACLLAALGWTAVQVAWRVSVVREWRRRRARMA
jgi:uncharacterized protein (DUF2062 family)